MESLASVDNASTSAGTTAYDGEKKAANDDGGLVTLEDLFVDEEGQQRGK